MMLPTILTPVLSLVSVACAAPRSTHGIDGRARSSETSVVKVYDLSSALPGSLLMGGAEGLLPFLSTDTPTRSEEWDPTLGADELIHFLRSLCGDEFDYEDRTILLEDDGRLIVKAPPAVQAKTESYLAFLEGIFGASTELRIDAVELPDGDATETVPGLLSLADADKLLARGGRGVRSWRLRVRAGAAAGLDLTRVANMVTDYNVEIAQAATIADPIVEDVAVGVRLSVRAAPSPGGTWISLILKRGDPLGEIVDRQIRLEGQVNTQERVIAQELARIYQSQDVLNRSFALDTYLPENRVLAIQSSILTGASGPKARAEVLLVRRGSGSLPIFRQITLDPKAPRARGSVLFLNAESVVPPRCEIEAPAFPKTTMPSSWSMAREGPSIWTMFSANSFDVIREVLGSGAENLEIREVGPCLFLSREASVEAPDAPILPNQGNEGLDLLERYAPPARVVQVSMALRRAGAPAAIARCSIPIRVGRSGCAVLGTESIEVADYDVEVAQSASVADSVMRIGFDGVAIHVRPSLTLSGDIALDVKARAHVRRGERRELDLGVGSLGTIDESTHDQLFVREKLVFGKGEGAARRFVLGDSSESSAAGSLALEVEAVEVK